VPVAGAAEEPVIGDPERGAGGGPLADPVLTEPVVLVPGKVREIGRDDLAELAERAGDQGHLRAFRRVLGHRRAGPDRLVVGVGVHEQQPPAFGLVHAVRIARRRSIPPARARAGRIYCHDRQLPAPAG
jgi:hypothetical protein